MKWWNNLRERLAALQGRPALDALLAHASPTKSLAERVEWAEDLCAWVRRDTPTVRVKLLLQLLERQPEAQARVAKTLRSLVRETQALDLFADTGLPREVAFTHELMRRIMSRLLPDRPDTRDLADIFDRLFPQGPDADWLEQIDADLARGILDLFHHDEANDKTNWIGLREDLEDALVQLSDRICVTGSGREVRGRLPKMNFRELPFQKLPPAIEVLLAKQQAGTPVAELSAELHHVRGLADACDRAVDEVIGQLEKTGVNTRLVYDIARLRAQVRRLELLLEAWAAPNQDPVHTLTLLADLVRQNHSRKSVVELFKQNLHLLTRRIVERNAETGEHYVARNGREYLGMLHSAAGGGVLMGLATFIKLLLAKLALVGFFRGATFGLNYATSFVVIQLCGFTVATKQPATTAPALARRMEELRTTQQLEALVDEVVFLIRSQTAAVFGNLALVIPAMLFCDWIWRLITGQHIVDAHKAETLLEAVAPLSGCWIFAAFTGVLLWISSLFAAWSDNWFVLHQLRPALAQNRLWHRLFGPTRVRNFALWLERNIAGLAGNISLGLMLGLVPEVALFFGLPLDVRHVTLSTGQVTAAFATLGVAQLWAWSTVWIVLGILGVGALNILVSFGLALWVAIRARNVRGPERHLFFQALRRRVLRKPLSFILPIGVTNGNAVSGH